MVLSCIACLAVGGVGLEVCRPDYKACGER